MSHTETIRGLRVVVTIFFTLTTLFCFPNFYSLCILLLDSKSNIASLMHALAFDARVW